MKNIKVRTKLTIIVALVLVLVASESFISIQNMNQLKNVRTVIKVRLNWNKNLFECYVNKDMNIYQFIQKMT